MDPRDSGSIAERIEKIESDNARLLRELRRAKRIAAALALGCVIVVGGGAMQEPGPVNASLLNIIGPNGKVRIVLGVTNNDMAQIELFDNGGDSHLKIETDAQGGHSAIKMRDVKDVMRVDFGINGETNEALLAIDGVTK